MATDRAAARRGSASSTWCSTSSPISSSSAGCRATRSRPTAPTCSSSGASSRSAHVTALDASPADVSDFLTELAAGDGRHRPASPATIHRKAACLRSFYRHLRREGVRDSDPTASLSAAAARPQAAPGADARRGRAAARAAAGHRAVALRDRALLELMYACGLRASEAIGLEVGDVDLEDRCCARAARARRSGSCRSAHGGARRCALYLERGRPALVDERGRAARCSSTSAAGR